MPLQFCIPIYGLIIACCILTGVTLLGMAMVALYEMGCTEVSATLSMIGFWGFLRLLIPPWSETRRALFPLFPKHSDPNAPKFLAVDHFVYYGENNEKEKAGDTSQCTGRAVKTCPGELSAVAASPACAICLSPWKAGDKLSMGRSCRHVFHRECLSMWLPKSTTCPYCRCDLEARCASIGMVDKVEDTTTVSQQYGLDWVFDMLFNG